MAERPLGYNVQDGHSTHILTAFWPQQGALCIYLCLKYDLIDNIVVKFITIRKKYQVRPNQRKAKAVFIHPLK